MERQSYRDAVRRVARLRFEREHVTDTETITRIEHELAHAEAALAVQEQRGTGTAARSRAGHSGAEL